MRIPIETRYPCPVCLGSTLVKVLIERHDMFLDHCDRCGGVWFDAGEIHRVRQADPAELWKRIAQHDDVYAMHCHSCDTLLTRDAESCSACGWQVTLDCPRCHKPMESAVCAAVTFDACRDCRGVWVDNHELELLWMKEFKAALARREENVAGEGLGVFDALAFDPFLSYYAISAGGEVAGAALQGLPAVIEAAGEAASSVFEVIADIIAGFLG